VRSMRAAATLGVSCQNSMKKEEIRVAAETAYEARIKRTAESSARLRYITMKKKEEEA
jgi:hypothetical protein